MPELPDWNRRTESFFAATEITLWNLPDGYWNGETTDRLSNAPNRVYHLRYIDVSFKQCLLLVTEIALTWGTFLQKRLFLSFEYFAIPIGTKYITQSQWFRQELTRKCMLWLERNNIFFWNGSKNPFDGNIGSGDPQVDFTFCYCKIFWLLAISLDAAGTVQSYISNSFAYCYMGSRETIHGSLIMCLKQSFIFTWNSFPRPLSGSIELWNCLTCLVLDIEVTKRNNIKVLELYIGNFEGQSFLFQKSRNSSQSRQFGAKMVASSCVG